MGLFDILKKKNDKVFLGVLLAFILGIVLLSGIVIISVNYFQLEKDYQKSKDLNVAYGNIKSRLTEQNSELENQIVQLQDNLSLLSTQYNQKESELARKVRECARTNNTLTNCLTNSMQTAQKVNELEGNVLFKGGNATVNFNLIDGSRHIATYDVRILNNAINEGFLNRIIITAYDSGYSTDSISSLVGSNRLSRFSYKGQISPILRLQTFNGGTVTVENYLAFEDTSSVSNLANYIKARSSTDNEFLQNVLYIKSQLNVYTQNIVGEPRYPLETFLEGGGDCGASSLFVGSVIKAAHPDWTVQLWYVNSNSITSPSATINHAIVYVDNKRDIITFIETTADSYQDAFSVYKGQQVYGWSFDF